MSEYIKREDAIKAIQKRIDSPHMQNKWQQGASLSCLRAIDAIPSADVIEHKRGEWIDDEFLGQYRCSECDYYSVDEFDFCPNCGADMRGDDNE